MNLMHGCLRKRWNCEGEQWSECQGTVDAYFDRVLRPGGENVEHRDEGKKKDVETDQEEQNQRIQFEDIPNLTVPDLHQFLLTIRMSDELEGRTLVSPSSSNGTHGLLLVFDRQIQPSQDDIFLFGLFARLAQQTVQLSMASHFVQEFHRIGTELIGQCHVFILETGFREIGVPRRSTLKYFSLPERSRSSCPSSKAVRMGSIEARVM